MIKKGRLKEIFLLIGSFCRFEEGGKSLHLGLFAPLCKTLHSLIVERGRMMVRQRVKLAMVLDENKTFF